MKLAVLNGGLKEYKLRRVPKKIRIEKASSEHLWYHKLICQEFDVADIDPYGNVRIHTNVELKHSGWLRLSDCTILE
ncbi:hypothetical protein [Bacillus sp. NPDC094106]|uniref:hypothetical protein n=1 Tax=Bacillus sp. NPDC094106 TaxID=3363949 RepID=UPI003822DA34